MKWSIPLASCVHTDPKTIWKIFDPRVMIANFNKLAQEIEDKCGIDCVGLSFHPMRVLDTKKLLSAVKDEKIIIGSIDMPDVVDFFDGRMMNEFLRKQAISSFISRMKAHIGWRLINYPNIKELMRNMSYLINHTEIVYIRSGIGKTFIKDQEKIIELLNISSKMKIGFEIDSFSCKDFFSYLHDILDYKRFLKRENIGIALDPAHLLQGEAMGLWGDIYNVLENIRRPVVPGFGHNVFSLDYNPVQILNQKAFDSKSVDRSEEAMDEVIKMHSHPDQNVIDYPKYLKKVLEYFPDTLEEIVIEINPADRVNLGDKFFDDVREMNRVCEELK